VTIIICERYPASFWHALKLKATHGQHFATQAGAKRCVFAYIEGFYAAKGFLERQHEENAVKLGPSIAD